MSEGSVKFKIEQRARTGGVNSLRLAVESTLSTICKGHVTEVLVVNTSGIPTRVKHGS